MLTGTGIKGTPLMAIGYRYSSKATLFFICTQDAGSTRAGVPYEMKFTDSYKNVCVRYVDRPQVIADYFQDSNIIDTLNHVRQFELALEKKWCTHDPYFRLRTTMEGIGTCQVWFLSRFHCIFERFNLTQQDGNDVFIAKRHLPVKRFAGILANQLIRVADLTSTNIVPPPESITVEAGTATVSTMDSDIRGGESNRDVNGQSHPSCFLPKKTNRKER